MFVRMSSNNDHIELVAIFYAIHSLVREEFDGRDFKDKKNYSVPSYSFQTFKLTANKLPGSLKIMSSSHPQW